MSYWDNNWRNICRHWNQRPDNLKPLHLFETLKPRQEDPHVLANYDIERVRTNPYRGCNLQIIMLLYAGRKLSLSISNTRVINCCLQYNVGRANGEYVFNDLRDPVWGAEFLLGCLLPILYGRPMSWEDLRFIQNLSPTEIADISHVLCENKPDVWWPFYKKGVRVSNPRKTTVLSLLENNPKGLSAKEVCEILGPSAKHQLNYYRRTDRVIIHGGKYFLGEKLFERGELRSIIFKAMPATTEQIWKLLRGRGRETTLRKILNHSLENLKRDQLIHCDNGVWKPRH